MKTIFAAYCESDMVEGRGPKIIDLCFTKEKDAKDYIDEQPGIMGRKMKWSEEKYGDWQVRRIIVLESLSEMKCLEQEKLKNKALAKLTDAEKEALGLSGKPTTR